MRFHLMDQTGHSTVEFDKLDQADLDRAARMFSDLLEKGYTPAVKGQDGVHTSTRTFDPSAEDTLFQPQLVGG
jgi:hypothetical protein